MAEIQDAELVNTPTSKNDGCPPIVSSTDMKWFVMRVTYSRELKAQKFLKESGVESFVPMVCDRGEEGKRYIPAIHNLVFVHTSRGFMDEYKHRMEEAIPLRYMMDRSTGLPMVVRDKEMEDFIRVTADMDEGVLYLDNPSVVVEKGTPVEIVSGPFKGVQGMLLRIRRDRKVVLQLAGVVAVAVDGIPMEWCKVIEV